MKIEFVDWYANKDGQKRRLDFPEDMREALTQVYKDAGWTISKVTGTYDDPVQK